MIKTLLSALAVASICLMPAVAAESGEGEFDGECVMGLALGKEIKTEQPEPGVVVFATEAGKSYTIEPSNTAERQ